MAITAIDVVVIFVFLPIVVINRLVNNYDKNSFLLCITIRCVPRSDNFSVYARHERKVSQGYQGLLEVLKAQLESEDLAH
jgi:hypothetical protein